MKRIKNFSLYIKESADVNDDMFQEFIDLGYDVFTKDVYAKNIENFKRGATDTEPKHTIGEIKGMKVSIRPNNNSSIGNNINISNYIENLKELIQIFEILESRLDSEVIIEYNPNIDLYLSDKTEKIDNSKVLDDLRQIKEYLDLRFQKTLYRYEVVVNEEDMEIDIMDIGNQASNIQKILRSTGFKNLNETSKRMVFDKFHYKHQDEGANYATLRYKLVSRIINN